MMTKEKLITELYAAKALTTVVDIDRILVILEAMPTETTKATSNEKVSAELMQTLVNRIERTLHNIDNSSFFDSDSAEFSISYNNQICLDSVDPERDYIIQEIAEALEDFIEDEEEGEESEE